MSWSLVILAAGAGRRFGGRKPLAPVGPCGETLLEYAVYDALRSGAGDVVLIVRPGAEAEFQNVLMRIPADVRYVGQTAPAGAPRRDKPWGTGHALLCAREAVRGPFAVVNADDFYGRAASTLAGGFLRNAGESAAAGAGETAADYGLVTYRLGATLPPRGAVARAVCRVSAAGLLEEVEEVNGIERNGSDARVTPGPRTLSGRTWVSMNLWALTPAIFASLEAAFERFLRAARDSAAAPPPREGQPGAPSTGDCGGREAASPGVSASEAGPNAGDEFQLPAHLRSRIAGGQARVRALPCEGAWCGLTSRADLEFARGFVRSLVESGTYPAPLWGTN